MLSEMRLGFTPYVSKADAMDNVLEVVLEYLKEPVSVYRPS